MKTDKIQLKESTPADRIKAYEWLYFSDFLPCPSPVSKLTGKKPTLDEFSKDYNDHFFNGSDPGSGRAFIIALKSTGEEIGFIYYDSRYLLDSAAELDMWMKSSSYTGQGYGPAALSILSEELFKKGYKKLIIRSLQDNERIIKAGEKAGFAIVNSNTKEHYKPEFINICERGIENNKPVLLVLSKK